MCKETWRSFEEQGLNLHVSTRTMSTSTFHYALPSIEPQGFVVSRLEVWVRQIHHGRLWIQIQLTEENPMFRDSGQTADRTLHEPFDASRSIEIYRGLPVAAMHYSNQNRPEWEIEKRKDFIVLLAYKKNRRDRVQ